MSGVFAAEVCTTALEAAAERVVLKRSFQGVAAAAGAAMRFAAAGVLTLIGLVANASAQTPPKEPPQNQQPFPECHASLLWK